MQAQAIEFVSSNLLQQMEFEDRIEFILSNVMESKLLVLETEMNPNERLYLMQKALEKYDEDFIGIQLKEISIKLRTNSLLRHREVEASLLLVAPGNAEISHKDHGILSIALHE